MPWNMCKVCIFRSSCTYAKYHSGLCSTFIHSVVSNDSVSRQWMHKLIWAFAVVTFSHGMANMMRIWCLTFLSTLFKSYWDGGRVIMKGSVQWSAIQSWAEFRLPWDSNPGPLDPKLEALITQSPRLFKSLYTFMYYVLKFWYRNLKTHVNKRANLEQ